MKLSHNAKIGFLFVGDVVVLYAAFFLTLLLRYGLPLDQDVFSLHLFPFSVAFIIWVLVFYISGLYDLPRLRNNLDFIKTLLLALSVNALLTIAIFYLIPFFGIAPKTNLFVFIILFTIIETWWRRTFNIRASFREGLNKVLLLGENSTGGEIVKTVKDNPQIGYEIVAWWKKGLEDPEIKNLKTIIRTRGINLIVIPSEAKKNPSLTKAFFDLLASGVEIRDIPTFYEMVFRKVPIAEITEVWFLENQIGEKRFYDELKRGLEFILALLLILALLPLGILIVLLIKLTSRGPAIYQQVRAGLGGKGFVLYKFRTMRANAEKDGAKWAEQNDERTILLGRFLRYAHLDELPQLINILRGELSFTGPRPERPEFVKLLEAEIPYYNIRYLIKPGLTGWAQINYRYGASTEDAYEKLRYDIYYLKNRSLILDVAIILKTLKSFFINQK